MHSSLSRIRPELYYYASFAATPILGLVQTGVLTSLLSQAAFGSRQRVTPIVSWGVILGGLGAPQFLVRFYSRSGPALFWQGLSLSVLGTALVGMLLAGLALTVDLRLPYLVPGPALALLLVVALFTGQLSAIVKALLRVQERHVRYNLVVVLERLLVLVTVALTVWAWRSAPIEAFLLGTALGTLALLVPIAATRRGLWCTVIRTQALPRLPELVLFGGPIVAVMILGEMHASISRYVIGIAGLGTASVAKYTIAYTLATLSLQALYEPVVTYIHPRVFQAWEHQGQAAAQRILARYLWVYLAIGAPTALLCFVAEPWLIPLIANPSYLVEPGVFGALLGSSFLLGFYRFLSTRYYLTQRTGELALSYLAAVMLNFIVSLTLVRHYGIYGVALASLASAGLLCAIVWLRGRLLVDRVSASEADLANRPA